jgi:hypothetical protein
MLKFNDIIEAFGDAIFPPDYAPDPKKTPAKSLKRRREDDSNSEGEDGNPRPAKQRKVWK